MAEYTRYAQASNTGSVTQAIGNAKPFAFISVFVNNRDNYLSHCSRYLGHLLESNDIKKKRSLFVDKAIASKIFQF